MSYVEDSPPVIRIFAKIPVIRIFAKIRFWNRIKKPANLLALSNKYNRNEFFSLFCPFTLIHWIPNDSRLYQ